MPITIEKIVRKFSFNGVELPDPSPNLSIEDVRNTLALTHPAIANAAIEDPVKKGNVHTYKFVASVGTKG